MPLDPVIQLTKKLVAIPSPSGNEHKIASFVKGELEDSAQKIETVKVDNCGPCVVAYHRTKKKGAPTVVLNGHLDTVDVAQGWDTDPLRPIIDGDKLFGLGAGDMKSGLAILIDVFRKLRKLKGLNITLTAASDEEGDSLGSYSLIQKGKTKGDICLIPEPTGERIMMGCRGRFVVDIVVHGKAAHGARPYLGVNAIEDGARVVTNLNRMNPRTHHLLGRGSICVLKVWGGSDSLSVPERCVIRVDRHVVPGETKEIIMDDLKKTMSQIDIMSTLEFKWMDRPTPFLEPYITERTEFVKAFIFAHRDQLGLDENIVYGESVGDFNLFGKTMPTLVCGPSGIDWHSPNEHVLMSSVVKIRDLYLHYLRSIAKG